MIDILNKLDNKALEILNLIHKRGPLTKKNIQLIENIKLTTLNRIMNVLEDKKLIEKCGEAESTGGRKAAEYDMASSGFYIIGIDISRTYVKLIFTNMKLTVLKKEEFILDESYSPQKTMESIISIIEQVLQNLSIEKSQVLGIGIGTVGPIDREKGIILNPKGFFNNQWVNVPLKDMLEKKLSIPCFIDNGANTAVLAEYLFGSGKKLKSVVYIHCGIGIRSAIITDGGVIIRTMNDREDAFGHMIVDADGEMCSCGSRGCVECYSSIESIIKNISSEDEVNYKQIIESGIRNNDITVKLVSRGAEMLGIAVSNLVRLMNPELIILSGPLIMNIDNYYEKCIEAFYKINPYENKVVFSKGGRFQENVIAVGAAAMVMESYLKSIYRE